VENIFEEWSTRYITGAKINGNANSHPLASADHGFGCARIFLVCSIQVHPSAKLLID
jgi:hypothetical protein